VLSALNLVQADAELPADGECILEQHRTVYTGVRRLPEGEVRFVGLAPKPYLGGFDVLLRVPVEHPHFDTLGPIVAPYQRVNKGRGRPWFTTRIRIGPDVPVPDVLECIARLAPELGIGIQEVPEYVAEA
jgi:hypothetical protein